MTDAILARRIERAACRVAVFRMPKSGVQTVPEYNGPHVNPIYRQWLDEHASCLVGVYDSAVSRRSLEADLRLAGVRI